MHIRPLRLLRATPLALIMLALASAAFASGGGGGPSYEEGKANYVVFDPIVVNLREGSRMRFMQVKMQVMTKSVAAIHAMEKDKPVVIDALLMLLSHQDAETMRDVLGREKVRKEALYTLQKVLAEHAGIGTIKSAGNEHGAAPATAPSAATPAAGHDAAATEHAADTPTVPAEVVHDEIESPIEALYFTDFVIQ